MGFPFYWMCNRKLVIFKMMHSQLLEGLKCESK